MNSETLSILLLIIINSGSNRKNEYTLALGKLRQEDLEFEASKDKRHENSEHIVDSLSKVKFKLFFFFFLTVCVYVCASGGGGGSRQRLTV